MTRLLTFGLPGVVLVALIVAGEAPTSLLPLGVGALALVTPLVTMAAHQPPDPTEEP